GPAHGRAHRSRAGLSANAPPPRRGRAGAARERRLDPLAMRGRVRAGLTRAALASLLLAGAIASCRGSRAPEGKTASGASATVPPRNAKGDKMPKELSEAAARERAVALASRKFAATPLKDAAGKVVPAPAPALRRRRDLVHQPERPGDAHRGLGSPVRAEQQRRFEHADRHLYDVLGEGVGGARAAVVPGELGQPLGQLFEPGLALVVPMLDDRS